MSTPNARRISSEISWKVEAVLTAVEGANGLVWYYKNDQGTEVPLEAELLLMDFADEPPPAFRELTVFNGSGAQISVRVAPDRLEAVDPVGEQPIAHGESVTWKCFPREGTMCEGPEDAVAVVCRLASWTISSPQLPDPTFKVRWKATQEPPR